MIVKVHEHKVEIIKTPVNEQEVNVTKCTFEFDETIPNNYVKKAFFTLNGNAYEQTIVNNECDIPNEVLSKKGSIELGVVAYKVENEELIQRFNPSPDYFDSWTGSLKEADNTEPITPTDKEQIEQAITDLQNTKQDTLVSGTNIKTINNESLLGSGNLEVITDLSDYYTKEEVNTIKTTIEGEIPTKVSQLDNDSDFITKEVNNLTNYTTTSNMNTAISNAVGTETTNRQNADLNLQNQIDAITSASDVTDVVGTYQDLLDYDTSKLTEKDIIKVLQDSTHNNALAYYRWENNSWEYIGSEGPFYTKGETDELLNQKANASTTYTKTETDNLLNNKVGFTDYASSSRAGVVRAQNANGFGVNTDGFLYPLNSNYATYQNAINTYTISKGTLENVITGKQLVNQTTLDNSQALQDNEISDLKSENDYLNSIINQLPKVSSQGTILTLNNTINGRMNIELGTSELEQETTTGKNLFMSNQIGSTYSGITYTINSNGLISLTGTSTATYYKTMEVPINDSNLIDGNTYTMSATKTIPSGILFKIEVLSASSWLREYSISNNTPTKTFTLDLTNATRVKFVIQVNNGITVNLTDIGIQLELGSSATSFEKFTGGIPAPNPSFPMPIHTISGSNKAVVCGKNLFDKNTNDLLNAKYGAEVTADNNERMCFIKCKPNTQYTLYHLTTSPMRNSIGTTQILPSVGVTIEDGVYSATSPKTITTNANAKYIVWQFYATNDTQHTLQEVLDSMMIVEGDTLPNEYIPYTSQKADIDLVDLEYCEIGDYKDEFVRSSGSNLANPLLESGSINTSGEEIVDSGSRRMVNYIYFGNASTIYFKRNDNTINLKARWYDENKTFVSTSPGIGTVASATLTPPSNARYLRLCIDNNNDNYFTQYQVMVSTIDIPYEPYGIGNWGIRKNIGKVVLDGTENWGSVSNNRITTTLSAPAGDGWSSVICKCNYLKAVYQSMMPTTTQENIICTSVNSVYIRLTSNDTLSSITSWLGTAKPKLYYALATPKYTPITGTLAEELENIYQYLLSQKGQTNISQVSNDLPFVISASALLDLNTLVGE